MCSLSVDHIYLLEPTMASGGPVRYYVTRPEIIAVNQIVNHIKEDIKAKELRRYEIIFVPRKLASCEYILEREGVFGLVNLHNWNVHLVPLDEHVLSLENPETAKELILNGNLSILHSIATSLLALEQKFGTIPHFLGKGKFSIMVWEMFTRMKQATKVTSPVPMPAITDVILFDRSCDWVTPMCSQLTYEGMLDDVFTIQSGFVEFPKEGTEKSQVVKVLLNEKDPVFSLIRSMHFSAVSEVLVKISQELRIQYDHGRDKNKSIREMKEFVKVLPLLKEKHESLALHLNASDKVIKQKKDQDFQRQLNTEWVLLDGSDKAGAYEYIEETIENQKEINIPLQLLCLASATGDGIKSKYYTPFKQSFLQSYGHRHINALHNLSRAGLLKEKSREETRSSITKDETSSFSQLSRLLKLVPKDPSSHNLKEPTNASYVFGGAYIPLSCSVISHLVTKGSWAGIADVIKNWEGPTLDETQPTSFCSPHRVVLVYFIGGVTYSEINALKFLGAQFNCHFIIATTDIINWKRLLHSFISFEVSS